MTLRSVVVCLFWLIAAFGWPTAALAHKASDAYLQLAPDTPPGGLSLRWDIALRDLDAALDLDADNDQILNWGEVRKRLPDIRAYALARLVIQRGSTVCPLTEAAPDSVESRADGTYLVLQLESRGCNDTGPLSINYQLFGEIDPTHRGLLKTDTGSGGSPQLRSLDPTAGAVVVSTGAKDGTAGADAGAAGGGLTLFQDGVHHILIGYDHILFLICLLLPAVLVRPRAASNGAGPASGARQGGQPVDRWQQAAWPMLAIVTMFTLGHSITLGLAGLKIVNLSPRLIEPAIAITIIVAAIDNLRPLMGDHRRAFTFLFGLIHGFGFANVLAELDLPTSRFLAALLQFNLGVEAGQFIIVGIVLALLLALRRWRYYGIVVVRGGSLFAIAVAALWFIERVADIKILPV